MYTENIYFLTLKDALALSSQHDGEEWDLWMDIEAAERGRIRHICTALARADAHDLIDTIWREK